MDEFTKVVGCHRKAALRLLHRVGSQRQGRRRATGAGAAAVMTPVSELCRKEDVERLYQSMLAPAS